ncbi:MAG TPA: phosphoribosylaminoimidazolesuccinocarboxamide synthase [Verrucomicrobiales bacterium]|nr:phosphoribosylaminoimidazolesuccinocarboxamide synthase [Verrucomicrobiales bacterium]
MKQLYEGKAKKLFETESPDVLLMEFKDDATAFDGKKKAQFADKGRLNKALSLLLLRLLEREGIRTHLVEDRDETRMLVRHVEIIPIEVVVRNIAAGSLCRRTPLEEGSELRQPMVEYFYKDDALGDPMITEEHIRELDLASPEEVNLLKAEALRINALLRDFFMKGGMRLVDFKLEFGRLADGSVVLADEITPDTCRLWDAETGRKLDKDRFRRDLGDVMEAYAEVLRRAEGAVGH